MKNQLNGVIGFLTSNDLKNRSFYHFPIHHGTREVLQHKSSVKGIDKECDCEYCVPTDKK